MQLQSHKTSSSYVHLEKFNINKIREVKESFIQFSVQFFCWCMDEFELCDEKTVWLFRKLTDWLKDCLDRRVIKVNFLQFASVFRWFRVTLGSTQFKRNLLFSGVGGGRGWKSSLKTLAILNNYFWLGQFFSKGRVQIQIPSLATSLHLIQARHLWTIPKNRQHCIQIKAW